jgi:hypothetical protein
VIALAAALLSVAIVAQDDRLTAPPRIAAGLTTFTFDNHATEPHAIRFVRLAAPHTTDEFAAWLKTGGKTPAWVSTAGGVAAIAPNRSEQYTMSMAAGSYAIVDGERFVPMRVEGAAATAQAPDADVEIRLRDHGYQLNAPIPGGKPTLHLRNGGTEPHQALLVRLPERVSEFAIRAWISNGSHGAHPGEPMGGAIELPPDADAWVRVDLPAGRYLLLCGELEEEGRHFDLGMIYHFEIE